VALIQGGMDLAGRADPTAGTLLTDSLAVAAGISLLAGFLTPISAGLVALGATGMWMSLIQQPSPNLCASKLLVAFLAGVAAGVIFLGPGAFSADARLFGLREIVIPPHDRGRRGGSG
jgi:uncharacterized membrane protein YphA (DoxX/SURF4 family)